MDYFHPSIVERLAAENRSAALAHARQDGIARLAAPAPRSSRAWMSPSLIARLAQLVAQASIRRAPAWLRR
jgi:hypothetical protein